MINSDKVDEEIMVFPYFFYPKSQRQDSKTRNGNLSSTHRKEVSHNERGFKRTYQALKSLPDLSPDLSLCNVNEIKKSSHNNHITEVYLRGSVLVITL